ncbi:MAG: hypothetical protein IJW59_00460 [Clostridia bacterium]|nr:hypothetical protein [Clostridia bacterium]
MEEEKVFKCPNDLSVSVTKFNGDILIKEDGCTVVQLLLKNTGEMATSFFGAHSPQVIKVMEKALKGYFKKLKKTLKEEYRKDGNDEIEVKTDELPPDGTWENSLDEKQKTETENFKKCKKDCCCVDSKKPKKSNKCSKKTKDTSSEKSTKNDEKKSSQKFEVPLKTPANKLATPKKNKTTKKDK